MDRKTTCLLFRFMRPHHFLILMGFFTILSFILGYAISVSLDKVHYLFPYISDTGTTHPASSYFGLCLNLSSVFAAISMYYRHSFLEKQEGALTTLKLHMVNDVALLLGGLSAFGIMLVANFQETSVLFLHLIGATMTFALGNIYCWIHTYLTHVTCSAGGAVKKIVIVRAVLSLVSTLGFFLTVIGANLAGKANGGGTLILKWTPDLKVSITCFSFYSLPLLVIFSFNLVFYSVVYFFISSNYISN